MIFAGSFWNRPPHILFARGAAAGLERDVMDDQAIEYKADYKAPGPYKPYRYRLKGKALGRVVLLYTAGALFAAIAGFLIAFMLTGANPAAVINALPGLSPGSSAQTLSPAAHEGSGLHKLLRHDEPRDMPALRFADGDGRTVSLNDFRGKVVVLNFWATWCAPCKIEMPALDRLQATLGGDAFEVVALSVDRTGPAEPLRFLDREGLRNLALYIDETGESAIRVQAGGLPVTLILDREGREVARLLGIAAWDSAEAIEMFREYLAAR
jgi:thiol-disulfide isomerase/thioredoxin